MPPRPRFPRTRAQGRRRAHWATNQGARAQGRSLARARGEAAVRPRSARRQILRHRAAESPPRKGADESSQGRPRRARARVQRRRRAPRSAGTAAWAPRARRDLSAHPQPTAEPARGRGSEGPHSRAHGDSPDSHRLLPSLADGSTRSAFQARLAARDHGVRAPRTLARVDLLRAAPAPGHRPRQRGLRARAVQQGAARGRAPESEVRPQGRLYLSRAFGARTRTGPAGPARPPVLSGRLAE